MKLYPFQMEAVNRFENTTSVLIADDMGLGKTVEAIALDLRRRTKQITGNQSQAKTLIVAPLSVLGAWEEHLQLLWPGTSVCVINPKNRQELIDKLKWTYCYYIIHWEALRLIEELRDVEWWHIIADEVHRAKNRKAQQTLGLKKLKAKYKTGLSGTPADNNPQDLWSILNWLYPKQWTSFWSYTRYYVKIQTHNRGICMAEGCGGMHKQQFQKVCGVAHVDELMDAMKDYYIRRLKEDVINDLPDKYYTMRKVSLQPEQRRIYNQMRSDMLAWVGKHQHEPIAAPIVIAQLTRLKQFALSYAKLAKVMRRKDGETREVLTVQLSEPSTKLDAVMEILADTTEQVVVFSESKQIINLLDLRLEKAGISHVLLTGDTSQPDRVANIDAFQSGRVQVFAGTIAAGGIGITLTAASTVIFLDRTWNPSQNRQAEDRLHRIGQKSAVQVIDLVARDTVDGGRLQMVRLKWEWLKTLLGDKPSEITYQEEGDD